MRDPAPVHDDTDQPPAHEPVRPALVLDAEGRVLEAHGWDGDVPAHVSDLLPGSEPQLFAQLRAILAAAPGAALRLESGAGAELRLSALPDGSVLAERHGDSPDEDVRRRLHQRIAFERLIAALSTEFINVPPEGLDALIEAALGRLGALFDVDRAYLFRFSERCSVLTNTHEWVAEGVSREAANLQSVPATRFPWLMSEMLRGRAVHVPVVEALPEAASGERAEFMREGIRSLVLVPFGESESPEGFIGFDSVRRARHWEPELLVGLRLVGQMIFNAFRARDMAESLSHLAFHDALTGLGNRRLLRERLGYLLGRSRRTGERLAVMLVDLDDFKLVNDSFGHSLGDELLKAVAERLSRTLRASDTVARLGGDEFVVLAEFAQLADLDQLIERVFAALLEPIAVGGSQLSMRMSIGVSLHPDDGSDPENLLRQADTAMYAAKREGRNRHAFFTEEMTNASRAVLQLRHDLRRAIGSGEIVPHYQPRVDLRTRRVIGFEALARWDHPERGWLLPGAFLELAEQGGLIGEIDLGIVQHALADLARWRRLDPDCRVSVNLSAHDLYDEPLVQRLEDMLAAAGAAASGLELEITESALIRDVDLAATRLRRLRAAAPGLGIAIDDFGSGYSSLAYLDRLPVTTLKIDRSFIAKLGDGAPSAVAIVRSIMDLGRGLGLRVVAEGVETEAQAAYLRELECVEGQGYLYAAACTPERAEELLGGAEL